MRKILYTHFTDTNQIAQPDATRVARPVVTMPVPVHEEEDDRSSLYNMLPEVVVTAKYPHEQRVIDTMNASNAEFMNRLRNNDRRAIHNQDGSYSTHVLGSADNIVFPAIQDVNGELKDYRGLPWQRTLDKAIQNNDYIEFPTEGDARYFGDHYKKYFPEYFDNQYREDGGYISLMDMANQHIFEDGGEYGNGGKKNKYSFMDKLKMSMMNTIPLIPDPTTFNAPFDNVTGNVNDRTSSVAQVSYLLSRDKQQKLFEDYGYKRVYNDYGTVKRAAESKGYPIYQKNSDDASRKNLVPIGNADSDPFEVETTYKGKLMEVPTNWYAAPNKSLIEAGATRSTIYYNPDNGKYYQKAWDLNDYGGNGGSTADIFGKFLDIIGNPVVVTSGIQEVLPENINKVEKNYMLPYAKKHYLKKADNGHWEYVAPDVIIYGHKHAEGGFEDGGSLDNTLLKVIDNQHIFENGGTVSSNKGRRKGMMSPTRAPLVKRFWETDEEFKERTNGMTQEEIANYNKEADKEYADMAKHTAEERAQALSEAKKNGTYPKSTIVEKIGEASRKMHQSAENSNSFDSLRKAQNLLSQGVNTEIATARSITEAAQNYANEQAEKKQQQMRDIKKGFNAAATLGEWGAAGYTIGRLAVPRLLSNSTGVMGRVADFFTNNNVQLGANTIGSLADGYQLLTADNKFDKYENGIEFGGDTAGIIGGLDIVRNSNIFGRYSKPIDTVLDTIGLSAATWDILKNIPPFKYYYGKLKDYVNGTNETEEDNQYAEGGEMDAPKHWNELSMADKSDAIAAAVRNGVTTLEDIRKAWNDYANSGYREDSSYRDNSENIEDMGNTLDDYDDAYQEEAHEYLKGGYKPSAVIKNRIANWEGSSMQTNRSFEAEAKDFWNAIPSNVKSKLSQQQADALYSYSYNVGAGNFKKRVVPSLERYFNGNGSVEDVQRHMYATKDKDLRGLAKRRAVERAMFGGQPVEDVPSFDYDYSSNSSPYGHRFTVNNNFQTAGYLGPIVNRNNGELNNNGTNKLNVFMQALEGEPKQTIAESTPEPRYNALERLQNIYSMYGMDDYANEIGKYNPFAGLTFAEGGKKA